eukprot:TRINITY_DN1282_c0_g1_i19.p1 TRINITY_DN1282_c0_g1~~TRINITY_DN1282_c0_g1_i19.p1  ORF type:complete len:421 (-),score=36.17 TRINITY_DN1282_c0_g1_i19:475-1737(-)
MRLMVVLMYILAMLSSPAYGFESFWDKHEFAQMPWLVCGTVDSVRSNARDLKNAYAELMKLTTFKRDIESFSQGESVLLVCPHESLIRERCPQKDTLCATSPTTTTKQNWQSEGKLLKEALFEGEEVYRAYFEDRDRLILELLPEISILSKECNDRSGNHQATNASQYSFKIACLSSELAANFSQAIRLSTFTLASENYRRFPKGGLSLPNETIFWKTAQLNDNVLGGLYLIHSLISQVAAANSKKIIEAVQATHRDTHENKDENLKFGLRVTEMLELANKTCSNYSNPVLLRDLVVNPKTNDLENSLAQVKELLGCQKEENNRKWLTLYVEGFEALIRLARNTEDALQTKDGLKILMLLERSANAVHLVDEMYRRRWAFYKNGIISFGSVFVMMILYYFVYVPKNQPAVDAYGQFKKKY